MRLFIDSADPTEIKQAWEWGFLDGVTTNPSLAAKVGRPYKEIVSEILEIIGNDADVSLEVIATDSTDMISQAESLAAIDPRVVVKIPCTAEGVKATKYLSEKGIKVNMTLVFSVAQALLAAKVGAHYVSPFVGRLDDVAEHSGDEIVEEIAYMYDTYDFDTQILYASVRDVEHVEHAALAGADIATVPFSILEQLVNHPLTEKGLNSFLADWKDSGLELPV